MTRLRAILAVTLVTLSLAACKPFGQVDPAPSATPDYCHTASSVGDIRRCWGAATPPGSRASEAASSRPQPGYQRVLITVRVSSATGAVLRVPVHLFVQGRGSQGQLVYVRQTFEVFGHYEDITTPDTLAVDCSPRIASLDISLGTLRGPSETVTLITTLNGTNQAVHSSTIPATIAGSRRMVVIQSTVRVNS